jgi:hypothetical protein
VTLQVDSSDADGAVVGATGSAPAAVAGPSAAPTPLPTPTPTPAVTPAALSAAGSVTSVDGLAAVSWEAGAFTQPLVVTLTPALPTQPVPGFTSGGYGVQLAVQTTGSATPRAAVVAAPLTIHIGPQPGNLAPMTSTDGASWQPLQPLFSGALPRGARAGYSRNPDGSVDVETTTGGFFALLPEAARPPAPAALTGHFVRGELVLSWPAAAGAGGPAVGYRVTLTNRQFLSIPGETTAAVSLFHPRAPSVYRVVAADAAGLVSKPSRPLVVLPSRRPRGLPRSLPAWAWPLFDWQVAGRPGPRPRAPRTLPAWYWRWYDWRLAPFHIRA